MTINPEDKKYKLISNDEDLTGYDALTSYPAIPDFMKDMLTEFIGKENTPEVQAQMQNKVEKLGKELVADGHIIPERNMDGSFTLTPEQLKMIKPPYSANIPPTANISYPYNAGKAESVIDDKLRKIDLINNALSDFTTDEIVDYMVQRLDRHVTSQKRAYLANMVRQHSLPNYKEDQLLSMNEDIKFESVEQMVHLLNQVSNVSSSILTADTLSGTIMVKLDVRNLSESEVDNTTELVYNIITDHKPEGYELEVIHHTKQIY